jgi:hypothetical protein
MIPFYGKPRVAPGSAVLCGALAVARVGKKAVVMTKMATKDETILEPIRQIGVEVHVIPAAQTTYMKVVHTTADVDERQIYQLVNAGFFSLADLPPLEARRVHLAGIMTQEFDLDFIRGPNKRPSTVGGHAEFCAQGESGNALYCLRGHAR